MTDNPSGENDTVHFVETEQSVEPRGLPCPTIANRLLCQASSYFDPSYTDVE